MAQTYFDRWKRFIFSRKREVFPPEPPQAEDYAIVEHFLVLREQILDFLWNRHCIFPCYGIGPSLDLCFYG